MIKSLPPESTKLDNKRYMLGPEAAESALILYRITGNGTYQDGPWNVFLAIQKRTQTGIANATLLDVTREFETLKYVYLISSELELMRLDEYVFNTKAHPFKRQI
jgi:mannosyl-oligosaccharide alpha-1,2-mannosidase